MAPPSTLMPDLGAYQALPARWLMVTWHSGRVQVEVKPTSLTPGEARDLAAMLETAAREADRG